MRKIDFQYDYTNDPRDKVTQISQSKVVEYFSDRNHKMFQPYIQEQLQKQQKESENNQNKVVLKSLDFGDGRYVDYRDNIENINEFEIQNKIIIFITGIPGGINYYKKIKSSIGSKFCRMVDIYIPGIDKKDERRGQYQGRVEHMAQLIDDFMIKLGIDKAILLAHSFGGIIAKNFIYFKPQKVEGFIQICTVPMTLWEGQKKLLILEQEKYNLNFDQISFETLSNEDFRQQLALKVNQSREYLQKVSDQEKLQLVPLVLFSFLDILTMLKVRLSLKGDYHELFHRFRQLSQNIPRMIVYSQKDTLIYANTVEEEIYQYILGESALKRRITKLESPQPQLDVNNFSSNYIFRYDDTTHFLHNEKSDELGIIVKHFIRQIDSTEIINNQSKM